MPDNDDLRMNQNETLNCKLALMGVWTEACREAAAYFGVNPDGSGNFSSVTQAQAGSTAGTLAVDGISADEMTSRLAASLVEHFPDKTDIITGDPAAAKAYVKQYVVDLANHQALAQARTNSKLFHKQLNRAAVGLADEHGPYAPVPAAEEEFGVEQGRTLLMAALESPRGILNAYEICAASERMFGVAISGGDLRKCLQTSPTRDGVDMLWARGQVILAARAAGIQCFDTVFTDLDDQEGFEAEVLQNKAMGFDGKSLINPKQIRFVHQVFAPTEKEVRQAEKILRAYREQSAAGVGVFTVDGKMIDIAFIPGAERTLKLARACGMYDGEV